MQRRRIEISELQNDIKQLSGKLTDKFYEVIAACSEIDLIVLLYVILVALQSSEMKGKEEVMMKLTLLQVRLVIILMMKRV